MAAENKADAMAGKIFINYRRGDDPGHAGRLFDRLQDIFEPQQLFLDVDNIAPGLDFVRVLNERVAECDILLAVIGKGWIGARDRAGARRLDDPDDFVRIEIESALSQGKRVIPVLVGDAPMPRAEELPAPLRPLASRNAVRLTHERFRADTQGLIKALQQGLKEIETSRQAEAEAARRSEEEELRKRAELEAQQRAAKEEELRKKAELEAQQRAAKEEELRKKAELEARERAAEERRQRETAARQRLEEEKAFSAAKRTGTVLAFNSFLAAYPSGSFAEEARKFRAILQSREEAYQQTLTSDDPALFRSFLTTYKKGADVDRVRSRLRLLEPPQSWLPRPGVGIPAAAVVLLIGAAFYLLEGKPTPPPTQTALAPATPPSAPTAQLASGPSSDIRSNVTAPPALSQDQVAWDLLKDATDEVALKRFIAQYPNSALRENAAARITALEATRQPTRPGPDEVAWSLIKDTTDDSALKRFIAQFPDSPLREQAEIRIAALAAAQAAPADAVARSAPPPGPSPDEIAWNLVRDSKDRDQLRRFVEQFPNSAERAKAEQQIASLPVETPRPPPPNPPDPEELARLLQFELKRVGCFNGTVNGEFNDATKAAWHSFTKRASIDMPDDLSSAAIKAVRGINTRVCPLECPPGQTAQGDRCIAIAPPAPKAARQVVQQKNSACRIFEKRGGIKEEWCMTPSGSTMKRLDP